MTQGSPVYRVISQLENGEDVWVDVFNYTVAIVRGEKRLLYQNPWQHAMQVSHPGDSSWLIDVPRPDLYRYDDVFPTRPCQFHGECVRCARNVKAQVHAVFGADWCTHDKTGCDYCSGL